MKKLKAFVDGVATLIIVIFGLVSRSIFRRKQKGK